MNNPKMVVIDIVFTSQFSDLKLGAMIRKNGKLKLMSFRSFNLIMKI